MLSKGAKMSDHLFEYLGTWITKTSLGDIPSEAINVAKRAMIDYIGVTLAGEVSPISELLGQYVDQAGQLEESTLIGRTAKAPAETAAFVNAAQGHALDFDDCNDSMGGHPTIVVLPPALAVGEQVNATGAQLLEAFAIGVEVTCKVGRALNYEHYERGWHPTATLGVFGSAGAAAKLMGLDAERTTTALAIAASTSAGLKANFGTTTKPIQAGRAAQNGLFAAKLASLEATANPNAFEHMYGFAPVFNGEGKYSAELARTLGDPWDLQNPGISFKQYPCCASTHGAIDATLALRDQISDVSEITKIRVNPHPRRLPHTDRQVVTTGFEGKFSIQYVTAAALLRGYVGINDFEQDAIRDPEVQRLTALVDASPLPEERWGDDQFACEVTVELADGTVRHARVERPKGNDMNAPLTDEEIGRKFFNCCTASGRDESFAEELHGLLLHIDNEPSLDRLRGLLAVRS